MPEDLWLRLASYWEHWCYTGVILRAVAQTGIVLGALELVLESWAHTGMVVGEPGQRICGTGM